MDDILDLLMGVDKKNEIFNLWFEVNFLRHCFNSILTLNPEIHKDFDEKWIERCREMAAEEVRNRFPNCKIDFFKPGEKPEKKEEPASTLQEDESKRKAEEALASFRRWAGEPKSVIVDQREDLLCNPQVPEEDPSSSLPPSKES